MSNRFTRNIQNVGEIQNLPLYTNDQNDLISTDNMVYVRHNNAYEPILNKGVLGTGLTPEDVERIKGIIDDKFKGYTEGAIKELNNDKVTELEQSILNLIGDRLGGLKFDQDGFKKSLNEVLKKLELDEIADVQNLQREIEYIFDENNKSTSKKIDEVKSELSQMIDEKVQSQNAPFENVSPIISVSNTLSLSPFEDRLTLELIVHTDKEIDFKDLKIIKNYYNDESELIKETHQFTPFGSDDYEDKTIYHYGTNFNLNITDSYALLVYKDKPIKVFSYNDYVYKFDIKRNQNRINELNKKHSDYDDKIAQLEKRIEELEK